MEERFAGGMEPCGLTFSQTGELGSRPRQNTLGELALLDGEDLIGDVSALDKLFFVLSASLFDLYLETAYSWETRRVAAQGHRTQL